SLRRGIAAGGSQLAHDQVQGGCHGFTPFRPGRRGRVRSHFETVSGDHLGDRPTTRSGQGSNPKALARSSERTESPRNRASPRLSTQVVGKGVSSSPWGRWTARVMTGPPRPTRGVSGQPQRRQG